MSGDRKKKRKPRRKGQAGQGDAEASALSQDRARRRKVGANLLIVAVLTLFSIDGLPAYSKLHESLREGVDPFLKLTGLWQGRWTLFAPSPIKHRSYLTARFHFVDGRVHIWRSPDWAELGALQRARLFRHQEYFDSIREHGSRGAWEAFGQHLAENEGREAGGGLLPTRIELYRHWAHIPPPQVGLFERIDVGELPEGKFRFSVWTWKPQR